MTPSSRTSEKKPAKESLKRLRERLEEAEHTIEAIRTGAIDALVVSGPGGDQVYTLSGADRVYRIIVETMYEAALIMDFEGNILFCNRQFASLMRLPQEKITTQSIGNFVDYPQSSVLNGLLLRSRTEAVRERLTLTAPDGKEVYASLALNPISHNGQEIICMVIDDLTELENSNKVISLLKQKQRELEQSEHLLRLSEERFRSVVENSRDIIFRLNARIGLFEYISPSCREVCGYEVDEIKAMGIRESLAAVHTDDAAMLESQLDEISTAGHGHVEFRWRHKSGDYRWLSANLAIIPGNEGRPRYWDGTVRDITERKAIENEQRIHAEILKASNNELKYFNRMMVDREIRMIELKKEVNELSERLGLPKKYPQ